MSSFFIGDVDRTGAGPSFTAWKSFGYDLDGKATTKDSRDVCTLASGAGLDVQDDGPRGIDNAFGSRLLPVIKTVVKDPSEELTNTVRAGAYTYLLQIDGLSDDPKQTNLDVGGQLLLSAPFGPTPPSFTKSDDWPIRASTLTDGQLAEGAKTRFREAYINAGTWVSAPLGDVLLELKLAGEGPSLRLTVHHAFITFQHTSPTRLTNGVLAGILTTEEVVATARQWAGAVSRDICQGSAFDSIAEQLREASDILSDGTNTPGVPCDSVSLGIGFEADEVANPSRVVPDPPPGADPCAPVTDAGADH